MGNRCYNISHITLTFFTCVILLGFFPLSTFAQSSSEEEMYDVILEVKHDRKTLSIATFGLEKNGKYYIPIQSLGHIVKFNVNTSLKDGIASGFFISEENTYRIDTKKGTYTLRGKPYEFDPSNAFIFSQQLGIGDIYVTTDLLNKVWPLDLSLDPLKQVLQIQTTRKLPYELSTTRQTKRNNTLRKSAFAKERSPSGLPRIENAYKMFSLPAIGFSSTTRIGGTEKGLSQNINIRGRNDLLKTEASYNFGFSKESNEKFKFNNARLLMERKSYGDNDLPLGLQLVQFGDIRPRPSRLIDGALIGRGMLFSTDSQKQIRDFDQITVEGTAEPGWEIELYRGNELIGFQIVNNQGEYRFENISLNFNKTILKTILYGPEGQIKEEKETYNISNSMLKPGKTIFEASILDLNHDLILTGNRPKNRPEGLAHNYKIKRGISRWLSTFATFTGMPTQDKNHNYATIGTEMSLLGVSASAELYKDLSGGTAYDLRAAGAFKGINVNFRTSKFSDFESEEARFGNAARTSRTEFSLSRPFKSFLGNLGLRLKLDHEKFKANPDRTGFDFSQTFLSKGLRITHGNSINLTDRKHQNSEGRVNTTYRFNSNWQLRSLLNYNLYPNRRMRNLLSELRYRDGNNFTTSANINRNFQDQSTRIGSKISYDFKKFKAGLNTDWGRDEGFRSFLRATFSMAPYGRNSDYIFSSKNLSNRASLNGMVFLDKNNDGEFNGDDEPIEDAQIKIGARATKPSNADGYATYTGASKNNYEDITLNIDSLNTPFALSRVEGYSAVLRPSSPLFLDFPVVETGIIEGNIEASEGALSGVRMELLADGQVISTTSSAFDGFYVFEYVVPNNYTVRIDPSYEQVNIPPRAILVTPENLFHTDIDFQIFEQAGGVACVDKIEDDGRITQICPSSSTQSGMQPAHINSDWRDKFPTVQNVRITKGPRYIKVILDFDKKPNSYKVIQARHNKEISIFLANTNWGMKEKWKNLIPEVLKGYLVESLPNGDARVIMKAVKAIRIKEQSILKPDDTHGHRIYFEFIM